MILILITWLRWSQPSFPNIKLFSLFVISNTYKYMLFFKIALNACLPSHFSHVQCFASQWTAAHQAPLCMWFSRQEYLSGLPCPPPGESSQPRDRTQCLLGLLTYRHISLLSHQGSPKQLYWDIDTLCNSPLKAFKSMFLFVFSIFTVIQPPPQSILEYFLSPQEKLHVR